MKRFLTLIAIVALLAPAVAVCAGDPSQMGRRPGEHDCCPPDDMVVIADAAGVSTSMDVDSTACCERSAEAGQRVAIASSSMNVEGRAAAAVMSPVAAYAASPPASTVGLSRCHTGSRADSPPVLSPPISLRI